MDLNCRSGFLKLAGLVEGGTVVLAVALAWLSGIDVWGGMTVTLPATVIGLAATVPLFVVYRLAPRTRSVAVELMGQPLSRCRWYDLLALAALAGLGEEMLFRGVLQPWLSRSSPWLGLLGANILFGLVHSVTPMYALLATGIGIYLSGIVYACPQANLLSAVITHGVYDYIAFHLIRGEYRVLGTATQPGEPETGEPSTGSATTAPAEPE